MSTSSVTILPGNLALAYLIDSSSALTNPALLVDQLPHHTACKPVPDRIPSGTAPSETEKRSRSPATCVQWYRQSELQMERHPAALHPRGGPVRKREQFSPYQLNS
mmetsp:Transcript_42348/g.83496  ORF Transcript_42348/g.83496 Transcript_42348/m.83496 type:complete len:106 (+) Transcript_42348:367-684(+)